MQLQALSALCGCTAVAVQLGRPTRDAKPAGIKGAHMVHEQLLAVARECIELAWVAQQLFLALWRLKSRLELVKPFSGSICMRPLDLFSLEGKS